MAEGASIGPGDVIDRKYQIVRLIGEGGMGAVFEGTNTLIKRRVAIKVLLAAAKEAGNGVLERFEREAQAAGCIGSDHILEVLDLGSLPNGDRYMVMEYLDGESLADRIRRVGRMAPHEVAPLIRQALVGLDAAHAAGIVHRDLKPDNIYILREKAGRGDFVKIIDFGISKFNALSGDMSMTRTGAVMGTPYYMSPEQAKGAGGVNHLSDLYSVGVIAFESLTGKVPFEGTTFNDLMFKIVLSDMPSLEEAVPGIDPGFAGIVRRAMSRDTTTRFQSAQEFIAAIDDWVPHAKTGIHGTPPLLQEAVAATQRAGLAQTGVAPQGIAQSGLAQGGNAQSVASPGGAAALTPSAVPLSAVPATEPSGGTNFDWAASQADAPGGIPKKKAPVALYAGIGVAVLALVGGALALGGSSDEAPEAAGGLEPQVVAAPSPTPETAPAPPPTAPPPSAPPPATSAPAPSSASASPTTNPSAPLPAPVTHPPSTATAAKPVTKPAAKPAPAVPAPTPTPAKPAPSKPKTGPDFGY